MIRWFKKKKGRPEVDSDQVQEQFDGDVVPEEIPAAIEPIVEVSELVVEPEPEASTLHVAEIQESAVSELAAAVADEIGIPAELEDEAGKLSETGDESVSHPGKPGLFRRLRSRLSRTREALTSKLDRLFLGKKVIDAELLEELEELLITADMGVETSLGLIEAVRDKVKRKELTDPARLKTHLKAEMLTLLTGVAVPPLHPGKPHVVMVIGVNGVGKTTTIAKLAHHDLEQGEKVLLVAADTFRAAAIEQLEIWGQRAGAAVIKQKTGSDPAAVVFDGLAAALARRVDKVYIDTAGRLHTKVNLMEELKKVARTAAKQIEGAPHEVLLVLDATTGQNAINQARLFHEAIGVTGIIMTKLDGTAKGGVALGVVQETGLPLQFIGVGEQMDDLRPFEPEAYLEAILG
ncbi:MAG TPA: signal recognition particle-docking protein FtsY [Desulfobacterales bacterium]|nr:signal recognition particle-docking protein FtsY [Desulfobacterales bacterium]